jgi:hypothetical protein
MIEHGIKGLLFKCFNAEADEWYNPLKPYTLLEYQWVRENVPLTDKTVVIDAGCHHGNYSVVFKPAFVVAVDSVQENCYFAKQNMMLNDLRFEVHHQTLGKQGVNTHHKPGVYKCDIEGAEFELFPAEIARFPSVHTWILEIHPRHGSPNIIAEYFTDYELFKVCRDTMTVRPYKLGEAWKQHSTLIARK